MRVALARRFSWLRWMLTRDEMIVLIREFNAKQRAEAEPLRID